MTSSPVFWSSGVSVSRIFPILLPPGAKRWSPDHPFLYGLKVDLRKGNKVVDTVSSYVGLRKNLFAVRRAAAIQNFETIRRKHAA